MNYTLKGTNIEITDAIRSHLDEHVAKLTKYHSGITVARFEVELTTHHHHKGKIFRSEGNVSVPGKLLRAEETHEDLYAAIDSMARTLKRELVAYKDKWRSKRSS